MCAITPVATSYVYGARTERSEAAMRRGGLQCAIENQIAHSPIQQTAKHARFQCTAAYVAVQQVRSDGEWPRIAPAERAERRERQTRKRACEERGSLVDEFRRSSFEGHIQSNHIRSSPHSQMNSRECGLGVTPDTNSGDTGEQGAGRPESVSSPVVLVLLADQRALQDDLADLVLLIRLGRVKLCIRR